MWGAELAAQVTSVARSVTRHMPLRVICVTGGASAKTQKRMLDEGVDVVIGTPAASSTSSTKAWYAGSLSNYHIIYLEHG